MEVGGGEACKNVLIISFNIIEIAGFRSDPSTKSMCSMSQIRELISLLTKNGEIAESDGEIAKNRIERQHM